MIILDTDHLSLLDRNDLAGLVISGRLASAQDDHVVVSIVSYEEQMRGWLAYIAAALSQMRQIEAYKRLRRHVESYRDIPLID